MHTIYKHTKRATLAYPRSESFISKPNHLVMYLGRIKHTSDRIPNLSFRRSIQTFSPDMRKRVANVVESGDIRTAESGRMYVPLWYDAHVDNGYCTRENRA